MFLHAYRERYEFLRTPTHGIRKVPLKNGPKKHQLVNFLSTKENEIPLTYGRVCFLYKTLLS